MERGFFMIFMIGGCLSARIITIIKNPRSIFFAIFIMQHVKHRYLCGGKHVLSAQEIDQAAKEGGKGYDQ